MKVKKYRKGMVGLKISKRKVIAYIKLFLEVAAVILIVVFMFKFAFSMTTQTAQDVLESQSASSAQSEQTE